VRVGGGAQRLEALLKKEQAGTLLNTPLDLVAEAKGFNRLARARDELGAYQGIVAAMRRDTAQRMKPQAQAFIRGFHASVGWLADGANRDEAVGILTARMRGMEREPPSAPTSACSTRPTAYTETCASTGTGSPRSCACARPMRSRARPSRTRAAMSTCPISKGR
jgi:hypothetical protein